MGYVTHKKKTLIWNKFNDWQWDKSIFVGGNGYKLILIESSSED